MVRTPKHDSDYVDEAVAVSSQALRRLLIKKLTHLNRTMTLVERG